MPVVTIVATPHPAIPVLLAAVADAVAAALELGDGDVIATHLASGASVVSGTEAGAAWPIVSIQGSSRDRERMEAARDAAASTVREWCAAESVACEGVWTQWLLPMPA